MAQFADLSDLEAYIGRPLASDKQDQAEMMLRLASASIQTECRQRIEKVTGDVIELHPAHGTHEVFLPERPVLAVSEIKVGGFVIVGFEFSPYGRIRWHGDFTDMASVIINSPVIEEPDWPPVVLVKYDHGYEIIPDDILGVTVSAAARAIKNPEGYQREQIGATYQAEYGDAKGIALTAEEKETLRRYRQRSAAA